MKKIIIAVLFIATFFTSTLTAKIKPEGVETIKKKIFHFMKKGNFDNMVNQLIMEQTLDKHFKELKKRLDETKPTWLFYMNSKARHLIFKEQLGTNWPDPMYAATSYNYEGYDNDFIKQVKNFRTKVLNIARAYLKKPENLKKVYLQFKSTFLKKAERYGLSNVLKGHLVEVLKYFNGTIDQDTKNVLEKKFQLYQHWIKSNMNETSYTKLYEYKNWLTWEWKKGKNSGWHSMSKVYEFVKRRKNEGGQKLIDMWTWCIQDLIKSL